MMNKMMKKIAAALTVATISLTAVPAAVSADASWENHVTISEPSQGDPRCCDCGSHLDYKYTSNNEHYFQCTGCGNKFMKKLCGIWFRA